MKRGHTLSQASITELRRAIADVAALKASIRQESLRGSLIRSGAPHYVVETPTGGIPAASGDPLQPGSATCKLYWREGDPKTLTNTNRDQTVYNLSTSAVAGGVFVLAHRDGWGDMWVSQDVPGCSEIENLVPGSYAATVGEAISGGASGSVIYDGTIYTAKNQSACNVVIGDLIILHVTQDCELVFTPCVCDCNQTTPTSCCDKYIAICINNQVRIVAVNGGVATWNLSDCCGCEDTATFSISLTCVTDTITASWTYTCGEDEYTGTLDYSSLCDDPVVEPVDEITAGGCTITISASIDAEACDGCAEPTPPPDPVPTECCEDSVPGRLKLTISGSVYFMDYDGEDWVYEGPINGCATNVIFKLSCISESWTFTATNPGDNCEFNVNTQLHVSCSPFQHDILFTVIDGGTGDCPCVGAASGSITS